MLEIAVVLLAIIVGLFIGVRVGADISINKLLDQIEDLEDGNRNDILNIEYKGREVSITKP